MEITIQQAEAFINNYCIDMPVEDAGLNLVTAAEKRAFPEQVRVGDVKIAPGVWMRQDDADAALYEGRDD